MLRVRIFLIARDFYGLNRALRKRQIFAEDFDRRFIRARILKKRFRLCKCALH